MISSKVQFLINMYTTPKCFSQELLTTGTLLKIAGG